MFRSAYFAVASACVYDGPRNRSTSGRFLTGYQHRGDLSRTSGRNANSPAILFVHPNCELYGSDRQLIQSVAAVRERWPLASIVVVLPCQGPLADRLRRFDPQILYERMTVPRRSNLLPFILNVPLLIWRVAKAYRRMAAFDLVYINTVLPIDYLLASRASATAKLVHVHEIPTGWERIAFARMLAFSRGDFIFISNAVRETFPELRRRRSHVIWNGTREFHSLPSVPQGLLNILMIGRLNAWKGQGVLLEALGRLTPVKRDELRVRLVGSAYEDARQHERRLRERIEDGPLGDIVSLHDFDPDPDAHYAWADVVVVPSIKPEPFGLVAIEAMASGRAVIAADHGGLVEIVVDGETGVRTPPGDAAALADAIRGYLADRDLARRHGAAGRRRYEREFRDDVHRARIADEAEAALAAHAPA